MDEQNDELLTVAESAKSLKVSPYTIYRWIAAGRLPAVRFSRKVIRIRRSDLNASTQTAATQTLAEQRLEYTAVREVATLPYGTNTARNKEKEDVRDLLERYKERVSRPRSPDEPPKGSAEALLRHVGVVSEGVGGELWRVVQDARETSKRDPEHQLS